MRERYELAEAEERRAYRSAIVMVIIAAAAATALASVPFADISIIGRLALIVVYPVVLAITALVASICLVIASTFIIEPPGPFDLTILRAAATLAWADAARFAVLLMAGPVLGLIAAAIVLMVLLHRLFELEGVEALVIGPVILLVCTGTSWGALHAVASLM